MTYALDITMRMSPSPSCKALCSFMAHLHVSLGMSCMSSPYSHHVPLAWLVLLKLLSEASREHEEAASSAAKKSQGEVEEALSALVKQHVSSAQLVSSSAREAAFRVPREESPRYVLQCHGRVIFSQQMSACLEPALISSVSLQALFCLVCAVCWLRTSLWLRSMMQMHLVHPQPFNFLRTGWLLVSRAGDLCLRHWLRRIAALLKEVDGKQAELGVLSYGLSSTTLEEVFLNVSASKGESRLASIVALCMQQTRLHAASW